MRDELFGECLWETAVNNLAVSLLVAHLIGTHVIEIVCGRRVVIDIAGPRGRVSNPEDEDVVRQISKRFVDGVWQAYGRAYSDLGIIIPQVAVALEMEPDILALARDLTSIKNLRLALEKGPSSAGILDSFRSEMADHFGVNLDWGHLLIALDRTDPRKSHQIREHTGQLLSELKPFILHAHVADHARGAHWIDGPLGAYRPSSEFNFLYHYYAHLIQDRELRKPNLTGPEQFASGAVAIELEARGDVSLAVQSRDQLDSLAKDCDCTIETMEDRVRTIEHGIAALPPRAVRRGWFEGVNGTIFHSLERLVYRSTAPQQDFTPLLDEELLAIIREFLTCRKNDIRTIYAIEIAERSLTLCGVGVLSSWIRYLLHQEWWGAFYPTYRDHTVHSVYVYLLGWFLYAESPWIRHLFQGDDVLRLPTLESDFAREWMIAALAHDIGYPLESDKPDVRIALIDKLNSYHEFFISWAILSKGDPQSVEYKWHERENDAIAFDLKGTKFNPLFRRPSKDRDQKTGRGIPEEDDLELIDVAGQSGVFTAISEEDEQNLGLGQGGFSLIHDYLRRVPPRGRLASSERPAFLDHGIMSASILAALKSAHDDWSLVIEKNRERIKERVESAVTIEVRDEVREWPSKYRKSIWFENDESFSAILSAIAAHNIYPESGHDPEGNFHCLDDVNDEINGCPILRAFAISEKTPLAFLLAMCDSLQEWHRYGFTSPTTVKPKALDPLEVEMRVNPRQHIVSVSYLGKESLTARKRNEFDARFGALWKNVIDFQI
jgi:hypothetical protein